VKNLKCPLYELVYGKKTDKEEKCVKDLVGTGIRRETLKNMKK
jgi:hypothetical protein